MSRVLVVGAGISGLTAALELLAAGVDPADVTVVEARARTGGVLHAGRVGGVLVDLGTEAMLARRPEGTALAGSIGLADRLVAPGPARAAVWRADGPRPLPAGTLMGVPGSTTDLTGILRPAELRLTDEAIAAAARTGRSGPAAPSGSTPEDMSLPVDVAVAPAVLAAVGRPVLDLLVEPLLGGVYAGRTDQLSLAQTLPVLDRARLAGEPLSQAVDRTAATTVAAGGAGSGGAPVFTGLQGGMAELARAATARLEQAGVRLLRGRTATALQRDAGAGRWRLRTEDGRNEHVLTADLVVLALPTTVTARLLAEAVPVAAELLARTPVAGVAVVALAVPDLHPSSSGLLVPPVEAAGSGLVVKAVTFSSAKWDWVARQDDTVTVLRASVGRIGEVAALQRDDASLVDLVRRDLAVLLGPGHQRALARADAVVARWGGALPQYLPGHAARRAQLLGAVATVGGLAVTGGFVDGVGVPACIAGARDAVTRLLQAPVPTGTLQA